MENEEQKRVTQSCIKELIKTGKAKLSSLCDVERGSSSCGSDDTTKFVHNLEPRKSGRKRPRNYTRKRQGVMSDFRRDTGLIDESIEMDPNGASFAIGSGRVGEESNSNSGESISTVTYVTCNTFLALMYFRTS